MCDFSNEDDTATPVSFEPITNEWVNGSGRDDFDYNLVNRFSIGIPHITEHSTELGVRSGLYAGIYANKFYATISRLENSVGVLNARKVNPAFNCYCAFKSSYFNVINSPYFLGKNYRKYADEGGSGRLLITQYYNDNDFRTGRHVSRLAYMSAKPRCAILNDDYENSNFSFLKTFKQSDQQIKLYCKTVEDINDLNIKYMPVFRMFITQK